MLHKLISSFGAIALFTAFSQAVTLNSLDTFEDLTVMSWGGGASPTNLTDGSNGSGHSLQISSGTFGFASHLATHNEDPRYTGNYTAAGATAIEAWFKNTGDTTLEMRLVLFTGFSDRWTSTTSFVIPPASGWVKATFSVTALTQVAGVGTLSDLLARVDKVMFRNNTGAPAAGGTFGSGRVQIDNVQVIGATTVSGHVNFGGGRTLSSMAVQLRNAGTLNNVGSPITVPVDGSGNYLLNLPAPGNYDLAIKPDGFLRRTINANASSGSVINANVNLVSGNIIGDNVIDLSDYTKLVVYFNRVSTDSNWTTPDGDGIRPVDADVDGNGVVDLTDYTVLVTAFNAIGDN